MSLIQNHALQIQIPIDCRMANAAVWLASFILLGLDSLDRRASFIAAWAVLLGLAAATWTVALLLRNTRHALIDLVSYEHAVTRGAPLPSVVTLMTPPD